ncbi:MAG: DUF4082 domain-containing protein [Fimbriimonadaceae bacterium]
MRKMLTLATAAMLAVSAIAQGPAIQAYTGGTQFSSFDSTNMTVGWGFTLTTAMFVTDLGFWDNTIATPLNHSHQVGIWDSVGTLMTSALVEVDDPLTGEFRYHTVGAPVTLDAGTYNLGAEIMADLVIDNYFSSAASLTMLTGVTFEGARRNATGGGFSNPTTAPSAPTVLGRIGPNMILRPVPEPATFLVLGIGALVAMRRRSKK